MSTHVSKVQYAIAIEGAEETEMIMETTTRNIERLAEGTTAKIGETVAISETEFAAVNEEIERLKETIAEIPEIPTKIDVANVEKVLENLKQKIQELPVEIEIDVSEAEEKLERLKEVIRPKVAIGPAPDGEIIERIPEVEISPKVAEFKEALSNVIRLIEETQVKAEGLEEPIKRLDATPVTEVGDAAEEAKEKLDDLDVSLVESVDDFQGFMSDVQQGIGLVSRLDYTVLAFERAAEKLDLRSFLSVTLSTISTVQMLIRVVKQLEAAQAAYNAVLAITRLLEGPRGWAVLAGAGAGVGLGAVYALTRPSPTETPMLTEEQLRRREAYRSVVPG